MKVFIRAFAMPVFYMAAGAWLADGQFWPFLIAFVIANTCSAYLYAEPLKKS